MGINIDIGIVTILTVIFVVAKLFFGWTASWIWVLAPIWMSILLLIVIIIFVFICIIIAALVAS